MTGFTVKNKHKSAYEGAEKTLERVEWHLR
jgi:hypothetical protein